MLLTSLNVLIDVLLLCMIILINEPIFSRYKCINIDLFNLN